MKTIRASTLRCLIAVLLFVIGGPQPVALGVAPAACGSDWCSGSDSNTAVNANGNSPQIYLGGVGVYYSDIHIAPGTSSQSGPCPNSGNPDGACISQAGIQNSLTRFFAHQGVGFEPYWLLGGPNSQFRGSTSDYCFGFIQGYWAMYNFQTTYFDSLYYTFLMGIDIEQLVGTGWFAGKSSTSAEDLANRTVINGFEDYISGKKSADGTCAIYGVNNFVLQYVVYSSPSNWSLMFGNISGGAYGVIGNTDVWTNVNSTSLVVGASDPGNFGAAKWFGSSSYDLGYQYNLSSGGNSAPDLDLFLDSVTMPVFGESLAQAVDFCLTQGC